MDSFKENINPVQDGGGVGKSVPDQDFTCNLSESRYRPLKFSDF